MIVSTLWYPELSFSGNCSPSSGRALGFLLFFLTVFYLKPSFSPPGGTQTTARPYEYGGLRMLGAVTPRTRGIVPQQDLIRIIRLS